MVFVEKKVKHRIRAHVEFVSFEFDFSFLDKHDVELSQFRSIKFLDDRIGVYCYVRDNERINKEYRWNEPKTLMRY